QLFPTRNPDPPTHAPGTLQPCLTFPFPVPAAAPGAGAGIEAKHGSDSPVMDFLRNLLQRTLGLGSDKPEKVLEELTLEGVSKFLQSERCDPRILCFTGAGFLPDPTPPSQPPTLLSFLPHPQPTVCHYFIRLLKEKGLLLRCYTQNIDTLERVAGLTQEDLVEAHGTFFTSHCVSSSCRKEYTLDWMKENIFSSLLPKCEKCQSVVKPGDAHTPCVFCPLLQDFQKVDLLIIMGTSLQVQPFASLVSRVPTSIPRLLINKEKTGQSDPFLSLMGMGSGMDFDSDKAYRDVAWLGDCDKGCLALAELLGWKKELEELVTKEHAIIDAKSGQASGPSASASSKGSGGTASPARPAKEAAAEEEESRRPKSKEEPRASPGGD
uniref:NAD-dependent protein deacetylase sirtuin-2 n=1 Tax=Sphenodon punctatus TaxID=8508 RepID=A0A8D0GB86_SPHPU